MSKRPTGNSPEDPQAAIDELADPQVTLDAGAQVTTSGKMTPDVTTDPLATQDARADATIAPNDDDPLMTADPYESYDPQMPKDILATALSEGEAATMDAETGVGTMSLRGATLGLEEQSQIREVCDKFESAWDRDDQEPSLEDFVPKDFDPGLRQTLVRQLLLLDIRYRKQKHKSLQPDEYLSRLPDCKEAVQSAFSRQKSSLPRGYGSAAIPKASKTKRESRPFHADDPTTRYRPTEFLARGGLGCVFHAQDEELKRLVALKEILPDHADNERLQEKFIFEAAVTGQLEHPGIVPVYGLGRYEDNQPYYAMRFIRGKSFRDVIEEFHQANSPLTAGTYFGRDFRLLLRRLVDACNAMHYAHEHGVLHRDLKPDNIMIGGYGETLVVDWGLAQIVGTESEEGQAGTTSSLIGLSGSGKNISDGCPVGTPIYMSPEQAHGRNAQLDARTDIYSLGAMLFNIITGNHSVEGKTIRDIVWNVRSGKTRNAASVVPSSPKALASICRKAMECEPPDRYATAIELAEDIDRWMSDELVHAHIGHETLAERAGRLIRRHKSWTISGAAALLAITTVAIMSALLINSAKERERIAKEQEEVAKVEAIAFKKDAVGRYRDSRDAIDTWLVQSSDVLEFFPGTQGVRERLLELATADYEKLSRRESQDPELELERGRALVKLGDLNEMQLDYDKATTHYDAALTLFETKSEDEELSLFFRSEHANVHTKFGLIYSNQDMRVEAQREFETAIEELTPLSKQTDDPLPLRLLAAAHGNAGALFAGLGKTDVAIEHLEEGEKQYELLGSASDDNSELGIARIRELLGRIYRDLGEHENALVYFNEAIDGLKPLVQAQPDHPDYFDALASAYNSEASSFRTRGLETQLFESLESSVGSYRELQAKRPDVPKYRADLATNLTNFGLALHESGANTKAEPILIEAHELLFDLVASYGRQIPQYREELARCQDALGQVFMEIKEDPGNVMQTAENSLNALMGDAKTDGETLRLFEQLAIVQSHLAQTYQRQGKTDLAPAKFEESQKRLEQLIEIRGAIPKYSNALAHIHYRYALMLHDQSDENANVHFENARDLWMAIEPPVASYTHELAWMLATCPVESVRDIEASLRFAQQAVELAPGNSHYVTTQVLTSLLAERTDQALTLLDEVKALRGHWIDRDFFVLAMVQQRSGQPDDARQSLSEAVTWMEQNRPYNANVQLLREMTESRLAGEAN